MTGRPLARRTVLRGMGASVALPLLDSMVPAFASMAPGPAPRRLVAVYVGNGMNMAGWTPPTDGALLLPFTLEPLERVRRAVTVISGLDNREGGSSDLGGLHSRIQPAWLTGTHARRTEGADVQAGVSLDQLAARTLGQHTSLGSLELALESVDRTHACEPAFACTYVSTLSWRDATTPLPMEADPRAAFERIFGDGRSVAERQRDDRRDLSILDRVASDMAALERRVGASDRTTLGSYFDAIRDVERRIAGASDRAVRERPEVSVGNFTGIPASYSEHARLMFELVGLAFQADVTRVATLLMVRERSDRSFPESGVMDAVHALSHHEDDAGKLARQAQLNRYHVGLLAGFLATLDATPDGDGVLLDRTAVLFGSGMSNSNLHAPLGVPTLVAGGRAMGLPGGRHLRAAPTTPLTNLHLTLLDAVGAPVERLGDSTARLNLGGDV